MRILQHDKKGPSQTIQLNKKNIQLWRQKNIFLYSPNIRPRLFNKIPQFETSSRHDQTI